MIKKYVNTFMPFGLIIVSIVLFISTFSMKTLSESAIGPAFVPQILAIMLFGLSVSDFIIQLKKCKATIALEKAEQVSQMENGEVSKNDENSQEEKMPFEKKYSFILTIGLIFLYAVAMKPIGFIITTILYLFLQIYIYSHKHDKKHLILYAAIAIITSVSIYFLFVKAFMLFLPAGILG